MLIRLLLVAFLIRGSDAVCECQHANQTIDPNEWPMIYIINAYDNGIPCTMNCTISAYSGDPTKGFTHFDMVQFDQSTQGTTTINIFNSDGTPFITGVNNTADGGGHGPYYDAISSTSNITIQVVQTGTPNVAFLGTLEQASTLVGATTPKPSTTPVPSTPKYTGPLAHNPNTVALDLMVAVDAGTGTTMEEYNQMKALVNLIVAQMSIVTDSASRGGTRLTLTTISPLNSYHALGKPWGLDQPTFKSTLTGQPYLGTRVSPFHDTITQILDSTPSPFKVNNSEEQSFQDSRPHAQRVLLIVTGSSSSDMGDLQDNKDSLMEKFQALDVHPVVLGFKMSDTNTIEAYKALGWTVSTTSASGTTNDDVNKFFSDAFLDGNILCPADTVEYDMSNPVVGDNHAHFHFDEPSHGLYKGPETHDDGKQTWDLTGQTGRYCNFQERTYTVTQVPHVAVCFEVFYELEVEKDYLRFYEGTGGDMVEVISLTGSDVSGSTFSINNNVTIVFSTDGWGVFGGFSVHMENCGQGTTIHPSTDNNG